MKRNILIKGILVFLFTLLCSNNSWAYDFKVDGIYYNVSGSEATVTYNSSYNYDSYSGRVVLPETVTYNGTTYMVTSIGDHAFDNSEELLEVTIPNSVISIGDHAFCSCFRLTQLTIPNSVTSIGDYAFGYCEKLSQLAIPDSVTSIGDYLFYFCSSLLDVSIPNSVTTIGDYAFYHCSSLLDISIPNSVTSIGSSAFAYCYSLSQLTIPDSVTSIGSYAFQYCTGIKTLTIEDGNKTLVTTLAERLFYNCPIETLYLGRDISYSSSPFSGKTSLKTLTLGNGVTSISSYAFRDCTSLSQLTIPNSVISIGDYAFSGCTELSQLTIANSVTTIGNYAFYNCACLSQLTIANSVTTIGNYAFYNCACLSQLTIPNSVTSIGSSAFRYCTSLSQLTIPNSVTSIGDSAFGSCSNLQEVDYNATACESAGSSSNPVFSECSNLINLLIGENVTTIPAYTFYKCTSLTKVTSLAPTPPTIYSTTFGSKLVEAEVSKTSLLMYASDDVWSNIASIYAIENTVKLYPVVISYEGDAIIKIYGGDKNGIIVEDGENVTIMPIGTNKDLLGTVDYNGRDITATLIADGVYTFVATEYQKQNRIYSHYVDSDNAFDISLSNRGQLIDEITVSAVNSVYSLRVKGDIDGTDIYTIRRLPNLQYLDLSQANIVSGGDAYYSNYETYNNTIGDYFFSDLSGLKHVKLPDSALSIENYAFRNCTSLVCINLPSSLNSISSNAFSSCKNIEGINCPNPTPPDISSSTFSSVDKSICVLNVPIGSSSAYWLHKYWGEFKNIYEVDFDRVVDGIKDIPNVENTTMYDGDEYQIYTLSGARVTTPIKENVYIFKYPNGTAKKVLVK